MISEDKYADLLLSLFDQKIGAAPDEEMLKQLHEQAADRYAKKTPPGYSDLKDKGVPRAYGDYIVWRELMDIAKKEKKDFILVTDDSKDDWRLKLSGKTIGPRPELLEEFRRETGQRVWLFTSEGFLIATKEAGSDSGLGQRHQRGRRASYRTDLSACVGGQTLQSEHRPRGGEWIGFRRQTLQSAGRARKDGRRVCERGIAPGG